jgi:hypothetical protein
MQQEIRMRDLFIEGRLHVYYGLIVLTILGLIGARQDVRWSLVLVVSAGIFVDLWIHGYRH